MLEAGDLIEAALLSAPAGAEFGENARRRRCQATCTGSWIL